MPEKAKRGAIYARISDDRGNPDPVSLEMQVIICREFAAEHGINVDDRFVFKEVHTGIDLWGRTRLEQVRHLILQRAIDVVLVHDIDRLSRQTEHQVFLWVEAEHAGVEMIFIHEPVDNSPEGQLVRFARGYAAKKEHEKIKDRVARGRNKRITDGKPLVSRKTLYGYQWQDPETKQKLVPKPSEALIVRRIFGLVASGTSCRQAAFLLTKEQIPTPGGADHWSPTMVRNIIRNPAYVGKPEAYRQATKNPQPTVAYPPGTMEGLVDEAVRDAALAVLPTFRVQSSRNNKKPDDFLLRGGIITCGHCGRSLAAFHDDRNKPCYECNSHREKQGGCPRPFILAHLIDHAVLAHIFQVLTDSEFLAQEVTRYQADQARMRDDLAALDGELTKVRADERKHERHYSNLGENDPLIPSILNKWRDAIVRRQQLEAAVEQAKAHRAHKHSPQSHQASLEAWRELVIANLLSLDYTERRMAIQALGIRVKLWKNGHEPRWEITMPPPMPQAIAESSDCRRSRRGRLARMRPASGPAWWRRPGGSR